MALHLRIAPLLITKRNCHTRAPPDEASQTRAENADQLCNAAEIIPLFDPKECVSSGVTMSVPYHRWIRRATRKLLLILHPDKRCNGSLASLVLKAGFEVTDPTIQAAFTGIVSTVMTLRDFVTDASFRVDVEMSDAPLVVPRTYPPASLDAAAGEETALAVWAEFTTASIEMVASKASHLTQERSACVEASTVRLAEEAIGWPEAKWDVDDDGSVEDAFKELDADGGGTISATELEAGLG